MPSIAWVIDFAIDHEMCGANGSMLSL